MLVTAVRQKDSRGGKADFQRFIEQPVEAMQTRWQEVPRDVLPNFIGCVTALQEFSNFARASFKAGRIGKPGNLYTESLAGCKASTASNEKK